MPEKVIKYRTAWDSTNNRGMVDVAFGDPANAQAARIDADNASELAALLGILRANGGVYIDSDDTGRIILKSEWSVPGA